MRFAGVCAAASALMCWSPACGVGLCLLDASARFLLRIELRSSVVFSTRVVLARKFGLIRESRLSFNVHLPMQGYWSSAAPVPLFQSIETAAVDGFPRGVLLVTASTSCDAVSVQENSRVPFTGSCGTFL
jgi:hypothetical protein